MILMQIRPEPIMLLKLPIMLLSNAPKFSLLCHHYAPVYPIKLQKCCYLSLKIYLFFNYMYFKAVESTELYD